MNIRQRLAEWIARPELEDLRIRNQRLVNQAEASVSEAVPDLQFKDGKLSEDSEAAIAIKALTDAPLANKLAPLELLYQQYKIEGKKDEALAAGRAQVGILARAIQVRVSAGIAEAEELFDHMLLVTEFPVIAREIGSEAGLHIRNRHALEPVARRYWEVLCAAASA